MSNRVDYLVLAWLMIPEPDCDPDDDDGIVFEQDGDLIYVVDVKALQG